MNEKGRLYLFKVIFDYMAVNPSQLLILPSLGGILLVCIHICWSKGGSCERIRWKRKVIL